MRTRKPLWNLLLVCLAGCGNDQAPPSAELAQDRASAAALAARREPAPPGVDHVAAAPKRPVIEETIAYGEAADRNLTGFLALPEGTFEPPPGILVIHDGGGLNEDTRALARRLAGEGFVVLAIDLFNDQIAASPKTAQSLMTDVSSEPEAALENIRQGIEYLRRYALVPKVAALGWSFGGTWSLQAGLTFPDQLDAVVVYYGQIVTNEARLQALESPLLGVFGGDDASIPSESIVKFRSALAGAGRDAAVRIYPNARHDFANPASEHYRGADAEDAWRRVVEFLAKRLDASA